MSNETKPVGEQSIQEQYAEMGKLKAQSKKMSTKIKTHLKKHKVKYMVAGGVVVGTGLGVLGYKIYSDCKFDELKESVDSLTAEIGDIINSSSNTTGDISAAENAIIEVSMGNITNITQVVRSGHAGDVIKCVDTGEEWSSKNKAVKAIGVSWTTLLKHLNGEIEDINGNVYIKLGSFNADEQPIAS